MSDEAYSYRILTRIDTDGSFGFTGLNPGKYYINTLVYETKSGIAERQVGTETIRSFNVYGHQLSSYDRPIMEKYQYLYNTVERLESFIEISAEGQILDRSVFTISGHIHPGVSIKLPPNKHLRLPCFWVSAQQIILPAFSKFTGLDSRKMSEEYDCYALHEEIILPLKNS